MIYAARFSLVAILFSCSAATLQAEVRLPHVFSDHMVLQHSAEVPVWGWAGPGEEVTVSLGQQQLKTKADDQGAWRVRLQPLKAGGPHELTVKGSSTVTISDVLVGEVWLCSGQSNMAMAVSRSLNPQSEAAAADFPQIRMITIARDPQLEPQDDAGGAWTVCSPQTVGGFSATAYFFGRALHEELEMPIGLINSSVGGTPIEAWTSLEAQEQAPALRPMLDETRLERERYDAKAQAAAYARRLAAWSKAVEAAKAAGKPLPAKPRPAKDPITGTGRPSVLYNGMIHPLVGYGIRGAIWYQGENNAGRSYSTIYGDQLATLIGDWRQRWGQGDFPFLFVQLPNYRAKVEQPVQTTGWVAVRDGMQRTLREVPQTGMAVTIDVGEERDIHPKNKQAVGQRLARWALAHTYAQKLVASGPIYSSSSIEGNRVTLHFDHVGGGLVSREGRPLVGFAIAGQNRQFVAAEAKIEGDTVVVSSPQVKQPASVRYAWSENPEASLLNEEGLPAAPLRTDDWSLQDELK